MKTPNNFVFPYANRHLFIVPSNASTLCLLYDRVEYTPDTVKGFVELLRPHLNAHLRSKDFIEEWGNHQRFAHPMCGSCVPATQAIFYAFDTDVLVPYRGEDDDGMFHWWCRDKETGSVIDASAEQYTDNGVLPPYGVGSSAAWYGWKGNPQIRALRLLNRVLSSSIMYEVDGDDYTPPGVLPV